MKYARTIGVKCYRRNVGAIAIEDRFIRFSEKGQSDLWGVLPNGQHFECEVKRLGKLPTHDQITWLHNMNDNGCAFWVDASVVFAGVIDALIKGNHVRYHSTQSRYGKVWGPSYEYDLV
jgi:hypothetical protein